MKSGLTVMKSGLTIKASGHDFVVFVVVKTDPDEGVLHGGVRGPS